MNEFVDKNRQLRIQRTIKALKANNMDAQFVPDTAALLEIVRQMLPKGAKIASGGSNTLKETGVEALLRSPDYDYYYRGRKDPATGEELDVKRIAYACPWFFASSNAVTENGELYNVDGGGNRVSAMIYGPEHVVLVVGYNKIVPDLDAAVRRVETVAGPINADRLDLPSGCRKLGYCVHCKGPGRVCCQYVVQAHQPFPGRITVLILPDSYGF